MNKSKKAVKNEGAKVLDKAGILAMCAPVESRIVEIPGWGASVKMKNLSFEELIQIRTDAGNDETARAAMIVAAVCEDLAISDAYKLQKSSGLKFAALLGTVEGFLNKRLDEDTIKN
jgi:hypothetical protein